MSAIKCQLLRTCRAPVQRGHVTVLNCSEVTSSDSECMWPATTIVLQ